MAATGLPLKIRDLAAPREPVDATRAEGRAWLVRALPLFRIFSGHARQLFLCIDMPDASDPEISSVRALVDTELSGLPEGHLDMRAAEAWSATLAEIPCRAAPDGAAGASSTPESDDAPARVTGPDAGANSETGGSK